MHNTFATERNINPGVSITSFDGTCRWLLLQSSHCRFPSLFFPKFVCDAIWLQKAFYSAAGFILYVVNTDHVFFAKTTITHGITKFNLSTLI